MLLDGTGNEKSLECCNICGGDLFFIEYSEKLDANYTNCVYCNTFYYEKPITSRMRRKLGDDKLSNIPIIYKSPNTKCYYEKISADRFGVSDNWYDIFIEEEVSKLSTFSQKEYDIIKIKLKERQKRKAELAVNPPPVYTLPKPKCPTCGSTYVQKISDLKKAGGAIMFGIFSTSARSQFECKNCGYKW